MVDRARLTIAVLAAGQSQRFGAADKLRAEFRGKPLGLHACQALSAAFAPSEAQLKVVISGTLRHACAYGWKDAGFTVVRNPNAKEGMGTSVAAAARLARRDSADFLLIALADMPLVPASHFVDLVRTARGQGPASIVASSCGNTNMPPAVFGADHFEQLDSLSGDIGARPMLERGTALACPAEWLVDVDTQHALKALH